MLNFSQVIFLPWSLRVFCQVLRRRWKVWYFNEDNTHLPKRGTGFFASCESRVAIFPQALNKRLANSNFCSDREFVLHSSYYRFTLNLIIRKGGLQSSVVKPKLKSSLYQAQSVQKIHWTNQNTKQTHDADAKRGKTSTVLLLIGWQSGARFLSNHVV